MPVNAKRRHALMLLVIGAGIYAAVPVHELGHAAACSYFGYDAPITITPFASYVSCGAEGAELAVVRTAGGGTAAALFLALPVPGAVRRRDGARTFLLAGGIGQVLNVTVEAGLPFWYNEATRAVMIAATVALTLWIERRRWPGRAQGVMRA